MNKEEKDFLLDGMTWSFSRVGAYRTCPHMFYLQYIEHAEKIGNGFSEWGSLCHSLFERYFKKELEFYELSEVYDAEYKAKVKSSFPSTAMAMSYYKRGKELFDRYEGEYKDYKVVGVEQKANTLIGERNFVGYIDLVLQDEDGEYKIVDFKSKKRFKDDDEKAEYAIQLYLYAKCVFELYGKYPKEMEFNMFRAGDIVKVAFSEEEFKASEKWAIDWINRIYDDEKFCDKIERDDVRDFKRNDFFCNFLCSVGHLCKRSVKCKEGDCGAHRQRTHPTGKGKARGRKLQSNHGVPGSRRL